MTGSNTVWSQPNGLQRKALQEALLSAFPNPPDMMMLLNLELDENYAELTAGSANYKFAVFQIITEAEAAGWLPNLVDVAAKQRPKNTKMRALMRSLGLTSAPPPAGRRLEDIVRTEGGFEDVMPWIGRLDKVASQICRIECPINQARGTGWLVASNLLLTNWHVVRRILSGDQKPTEVTCRFDYATRNGATAGGTEHKLAEQWCLDWSAASQAEIEGGPGDPAADQLDYALLRLAEAAGEQVALDGQPRGWVKVTRGVPTPPDRNIMFVVQHPEGDPLALSIGTSRGPNGNGTRVLHDVNTKKGSSGSPCLNAKLELVALHNAGDPLYDGVIGTPSTNQAVPIELILARLDTSAAPKFWQ